METKIAESQTATLVAERNESEEIKRKFSAGEFEGPLDLLWFLIHKSEINIYDIPIAQITEQYLEYLDYATQTDLGDLSEFYKWAAMLLNMKSKMLLPVDTVVGKEFKEDTEHMTVDSSAIPENWQGLSFETLDAVQQKTGVMPLVLHGGTGIPADMIAKAIDLGVSKINVNTECQLAFAAATRTYIEAGKDLSGKGFDPRKLLAPGFEAIKATVKEKMELFGSVNKA